MEDYTSRSWTLVVNHICCSVVFQAVTLDVKKSIPVIIEFDPAFENNAFSRTARSQLVVSYKDHPHEVPITLYMLNRITKLGNSVQEILFVLCLLLFSHFQYSL